jgi:glycine/D-amino acid oxidase-like deaminating enzyme
MTEHIDKRSRSLWMDVNVAPNARELEKDQSCDAVVIGAGMAGISTAYELAGEGQKVVIIDRGAIAGGITARTSAHLAPLCDDLTSAMIKLRGEEIARAFYESQAAAVDRIETIQKTEDIACDFRRLDGYLFQALDTASDVIDEELDAVRKVGAPVDRLVGVEALAHCQYQHALRYPRQATFHPLKYLSGVAAAIEAKGGEFFAGTAVRAIEESGGSVTVKSDRGTISAKAAVVATNSPIVDRLALHTKIAPYRT